MVFDAGFYQERARFMGLSNRADKHKKIVETVSSVAETLLAACLHGLADEPEPKSDPFATDTAAA